MHARERAGNSPSNSVENTMEDKLFATKQTTGIAVLTQGFEDTDADCT